MQAREQLAFFISFYCWLFLISFKLDNILFFMLAYQVFEASQFQLPTLPSHDIPEIKPQHHKVLGILIAHLTKESWFSGKYIIGFCG